MQALVFEIDFLNGPGATRTHGPRMTYPRPSSSLAQRSGAPLDRGPSPLQSCIITTAGKGPGPSGLNSINGICSNEPLDALVVIDVEVAPTQPPRNENRASASSIGPVIIVLPAEALTTCNLAMLSEIP